MLTLIQGPCQGALRSQVAAELLAAYGDIDVLSRRRTGAMRFALSGVVRGPRRPVPDHAATWAMTALRGRGSTLRPSWLRTGGLGSEGARAAGRDDHDRWPRTMRCRASGTGRGGSGRRPTSTVLDGRSRRGPDREVRVALSDTGLRASCRLECGTGRTRRCESDETRVPGRDQAPAFEERATSATLRGTMIVPKGAQAVTGVTSEVFAHWTSVEWPKPRALNPRAHRIHRRAF